MPGPVSHGPLTSALGSCSRARVPGWTIRACLGVLQPPWHLPPLWRVWPRMLRQAQSLTSPTTQAHLVTAGCTLRPLWKSYMNTPTASPSQNTWHLTSTVLKSHRWTWALELTLHSFPIVSCRLLERQAPELWGSGPCSGSASEWLWVGSCLLIPLGFGNFIPLFNRVSGRIRDAASAWYTVGAQ